MKQKILIFFFTWACAVNYLLELI